MALVMGGCGAKPEPDTATSGAEVRAGVATIDASGPLDFVLAPHQGDSPADREIARLQERMRQTPESAPLLERLGWAFVAKARASFDPGFYYFAEQCAQVLESRQPGSPEGRLLRGHVLHQQHRFQEAEPLARELVTSRGLAADFGLLGDVLMEQGRLDEAAEAYQQMMDLRPDLHSYARGAHLRWLKGDLSGARELMEMAAGSASPQASESAAWVTTRLAMLHFQADDRTAAGNTCASALGFQPDYPPALLLRGRMLLDDDHHLAEAIPVLEQAARLCPLPEYQWTLAEALNADGRESEARTVEAQLARTGAARDPRTYALYLATRGTSPETAVQLASAELRGRSDVFTQDAIAWAYAAAGQLPEANEHMDRALSEGTQDARLFFHAAVIAGRSGRSGDAERWFEKASDLMHLLLPSERDQLLLALPEIANPTASAFESDPSPLSTNDP